MAKHLSPHDRILRSTMAKPQVIKEFFNNYLPANIKKIIDLESVQLQKDSFIDDKLRMQITDLLYTAKFGRQQGYLYLLIEHQSKPDKLMPFRLLKYKLSIMEHHLKTTGNKQLPIIYPLIFYSGKHPYNHSTDIFDLFGSQKQLAEDIFYKPYQLIDLKQISDEELKDQLWFGVIARIMKYIYSKDILPYFKSLIPDLEYIEKNGDLDYIYSIISYLFEAAEIQDRTEFIDIIKTGLSDKEEKIMTLADHFRAEGREQAKTEARTLADHFRAEGREQAKTEARTLADHFRAEGREQAKTEARTLADHFRAEGREQAKTETKREMALKMLNKGLSIKEVSQLTEISEKDLLKLLNKIKKDKN